MKVKFLILAVLVLSWPSLAMEPDDTIYSFISSDKVKVKFKRSDIEKIPFFKDRLFGSLQAEKVEKKGNFHWSLTSNQLRDIRSIARKLNTLKVRRLKSNLDDLIILAEHASYGFFHLRPLFYNLLHYCLLNKITEFSAFQEKTLQNIFDEHQKSNPILFITLSINNQIFTVPYVSTIREIKMEIEKKKSIPEKFQKSLVHEGRKLDDSETCENYIIKPGSILQLFL